MKTILRNLLSVLRRFKMATLLNVLGLSVAFSAFILIMMQVDYDRNFDRGIKDVDRIFRVEVAYESGTKQAIINRPLAEAFIHHHRIFWPVRYWILGERALSFIRRRTVSGIISRSDGCVYFPSMRIYLRLICWTAVPIN